MAVSYSLNVDGAAAELVNKDNPSVHVNSTTICREKLVSIVNICKKRSKVSCPEQFELGCRSRDLRATQAPSHWLPQALNFTWNDL